MAAEMLNLISFWQSILLLLVKLPASGKNNTKYIILYNTKKEFLRPFLQVSRLKNGSIKL